MATKTQKAIKQIKKMKIKGVSVKEVESKGFTEDQKKRIRQMRRQLKGLNP